MSCLGIQTQRVGEPSPQDWKPAVGVQLGVRYYAEAPRGGPDWGLRLAFTLLYPQHKHRTPPESRNEYAK